MTSADTIPFGLPVSAWFSSIQIMLRCVHAHGTVSGESVPSAQQAWDHVAEVYLQVPSIMIRPRGSWRGSTSRVVAVLAVRTSKPRGASVPCASDLRSTLKRTRVTSSDVLALLPTAWMLRSATAAASAAGVRVARPCSHSRCRVSACACSLARCTHNGQR